MIKWSIILEKVFPQFRYHDKIKIYLISKEKFQSLLFVIGENCFEKYFRHGLILQNFYEYIKVYV